MLNSDLLLQTTTANGLSNPSVAVGLTGVADWSTQMPFLNLIKTMRPWHTGVNGQHHEFSDLEAAGYFDDGILDENGWLTRIPEGLDRLQGIFSWENSNENSNAEEYRAGRYVVTWEGEGDLEITGSWIEEVGGFNVNIIEQSPGRIVFENTNGSTMFVNINDTDPNGTGNYIRDTAIVKEEYEDLYQAGATFNPDWIDIVSDLREFRFMNWVETNNSTTSELSDKTNEDYFSYNQAGIPIEIMVELSNQTGTDMWINIPHLATNEYIEFTALYIRDNLDPELKVTVEYSNEPWNNAFSHANQRNPEIESMQERGLEMFPNAFNGFQARLNYYGIRASETMEIFSDVFGDVPETRLVRAAGIQTGNTWVTEQILNAPLAEELHEGNEEFIPPHTYFDAIAGTNYFGGTVVEDLEPGGLFEQVKAAIEDPNVDEYQFLADLMRDPTVSSSIPSVRGFLEDQKEIADDYGLSLLLYEGGQHIHHTFNTDEAAIEVEDFLIDFVRSEHMGELQQELWDMWQEIGGGAFMHFNDVAAPGRSGSWALLEDLTDSNPRSDVLFGLNETVEATFEDRGGEHFQNGVIARGTDGADILLGTSQEDFILAGSGDDILVGGEKNDGLHGGEGNDIAILNGVLSDYNISSDEAGYLFERNGQTDRLIQIEQVGFADGSIFKLNSNILSDTPDVITEPQYEVPEALLTPEIPVITGDSHEGTDGWDYLSYSSSEEAVNVDLLNNIGMGGDAAGDVYSKIDAIQGSIFNDTIRGDTANNFLDGAGGNDTVILSGNEADHSYQMVNGQLRIRGVDGADSIANMEFIEFENGGLYAFDDSLIANLETASSVILAGPTQGQTFIANTDSAEDFVGSQDTVDTVDYSQLLSGLGLDLSRDLGLVGQAQGDRFFDIDNIIGTNFNDYIATSRGDNVITTLDGGDNIIASLGSDYIDGGNGWDFISFKESNEGVTVDLSNSANNRGGDAEGDVLLNLEGVNGSSHKDLLRGDDHTNVLNGAAGNDVLEGGLGSDTLNGGDGWDTASYVHSTESVIINLQTDVLTGGEALGDRLQSIEAIKGSNHADTFEAGDEGGIYFIGSEGDDLFISHAGRDSFKGGEGADTFVFGQDSLSGRRDVIQDFNISDGDVIDISSFLIENQILENDIDNTVRFSQQNDSLIISINADGSDDNFVDLVELTNFSVQPEDHLSLFGG